MRLPLRLNFRSPSRWLLSGLVLVHLGTAAASLFLNLPLWGNVLVVGGLTVSLGHAWRRVARHGVRSLILRQDGEIDVIGDRETTTAVVGHGTVAMFWLVMLELRMGEEKRYLPITIDSIGTDAHRQLRLWLRWRVSAEAPV